MRLVVEFELAPNFSAETWISRWDRMQCRYLPDRQQRFSLMCDLVAALSPHPSYLVDLGCGTGSLAALLLETFSDCRVYGIDLDPSLLPLARTRLAAYGERFHCLQADLREPEWCTLLPSQGVDAAVSATALHWLSATRLDGLYGQIARLLRPGGLFLNADHVASLSAASQELCRRQRDCELAHADDSGADDWDGFWRAYGLALGFDLAAIRATLFDPWEGNEDGLPLTWHLDRLRAAGFERVDCFWRHACDAVLGGIMPGEGSAPSDEVRTPKEG